MLLDISLRRAMFDGQSSTMRLAECLAVSPFLMEQVVEEMRHQRMVR